ncbi:AAA family ATPase [Paraclostridium sordellii]|uniref:AAA family ATPase n=1 Tax=Paraclostridium sordellii TaxID=1505 RepID=UPI0005E35F1F|nr:AAA family ATPase [Paeniclostridium sordellii]CEP80539.1 phosphate transporter ATP-binding protein [[Clostridium] sordellii] [Paeniclostridium sordellii]
MNKKLKIKKLEYKNIFCDEFKDLRANNEIEFKKKIAILYGPNGTGKTSLSRVLEANNKQADMSFEVEFRGIDTVGDGEIFHVISDQNSRNVIKGEAKDYLLGDDIDREERLSKEIEIGFNNLCSSTRSKLKDVFKIATKTNKMLEIITDNEIKDFISNFANSKFQVDKIDKEKYINKVRSLNKEISHFNSEDEIYKFILENSKGANDIVHKIINLKLEDIKQNTKVREIEENDEAIKIINKFLYKDECVVCDNKDYKKEDLLKAKKRNKENIEKYLDEKTKKILEGIINLVKVQKTDPLDIEIILLDAIKTGDTDRVESLKNELSQYLENISKELVNLIIDSLDDTLVKNYDEYKKLIESQFQISEEDELYLKDVISENIGREININRDENNRIKITLGDDEILGTERDELGLSTGQQNFISLSFELLKAKKSKCKYIVLDDPISSFDSIYKNKIAFCIIKFLEKKQQIILTHNTELIKLLEFQAQGCFELYMFNNTEGSLNGFIKINKDEQELLLKLNKLLDLFRGDIWTYVKNKELFLMSMIPFMRGYANIIGNSTVYKQLCKVMHGYETDYVDIGCMYKLLFGGQEEALHISTKELLELNLENIEIVDNEKYPLLNKSLYHTLSYLFLRLRVEAKLCSLENNKVLNEINEGKVRHGEGYAGKTIQQIIDGVFDRRDQTKVKERVFFTSRKTLLNEFNHFEGNMNIFQPAIDITDKALEEEKDSILKTLLDLDNNEPNESTESTSLLDEVAITI